MLQTVSKNLKFFFIMFFLGVLLTGIFVPLYIDEISVKLLNARFFLEGAEKFSLLPQCANTIGLMLSWVFYPAAIALSFVFQYLEPFGIRASGVFFALVWFSLLAYWCYRQTTEDWFTRFCFLIAFSALGVLPYLWVLSRSEQFIILSILILCLLALYLPLKKSKWQSFIVTIAVVFIVSIFFYVHPKSLFFTPLILVLIWKITSSMHFFVRLSLFSYIIMLVFQVFFDASLMSECNDAPILRDLLKSYTLPLNLLIVHPFVFIELAFSNIIHLPERILNHLIFSNTFQSGWLPPLETPKIIRVLNEIIYYILFVLVVLTHLLSIFLSIFLLIRQKLEFRVVVAALLAVANIANAAFYVNQSFYDGLQYIGFSLLILCLLLSLKDSVVFVFLYRFYRLFLIPLIVLSVISMSTLLYFVTPILWSNSNYEDAKIPGQNTSIPVFKVDKHLESIRKLGAVCNIPENNARSIVVDQMTYFAYIQNSRPIHILYTATDYFGADLKGKKLISFLETVNSPGVIARCDFFPEVFDAYKIKDGRGYCCANLDKM
jgi:hypothetical protein